MCKLRVIQLRSFYSAQETCTRKKHAQETETRQTLQVSCTSMAGWVVEGCTTVYNTSKFWVYAFSVFAHASLLPLSLWCWCSFTVFTDSIPQSAWDGGYMYLRVGWNGLALSPESEEVIELHGGRCLQICFRHLLPHKKSLSPHKNCGRLGAWLLVRYAGYGIILLVWFDLTLLIALRRRL